MQRNGKKGKENMKSQFWSHPIMENEKCDSLTEVMKFVGYDEE